MILGMRLTLSLTCKPETMPEHLEQNLHQLRTFMTKTCILQTVTSNFYLVLLLQLPVLSFRVDQLPMSETVMGIWGSLVRLAGTSGGAISSTALPAAPFQPLSLTQSLPPSRSLLGPADQQDCKHCH